jgi:hypothetical protein
VHDTPIPPDTTDDQDAGDSGSPNVDFDCGVAPVFGQDGGAAYVSDAGVVTFEPVPPGTAEVFQVAVKDSANVSETITSATLTGSGTDAFQVLSSFPIPVPAGQQAFVTVSFRPPFGGTYSATLVLQTANMGPSLVELSGMAE